MAARGAVFRTLRRPMCQLTRTAGVSSTASRPYLAVLGDHHVARSLVPAVFSANSLSPLISSVTPYQLFSSDAAASASKVVLVKDDAHYEQAMKEVVSSKSLGIVYFTAQWCGPCKQITPYIDELSQQFDDVTFLKVDVDNLKLEETMKDSRIGVVPTFQFHKDGKLVGEMTGAVKDKLKNLVVTLRAKPQ